MPFGAMLVVAVGCKLASEKVLKVLEGWLLPGHHAGDPFYFTFPTPPVGGDMREGLCVLASRDRAVAPLGMPWHHQGAAHPVATAGPWWGPHHLPAAVRRHDSRVQHYKQRRQQQQQKQPQSTSQQPSQADIILAERH